MKKYAIPTYKERLVEIINLSYRLLCNKVAGCEIVVNNEASLQHQLSLILKQIGQHFLFTPNDRFIIELEKDVLLKSPTNKSPNQKPRCDIWLKIEDVNNKDSVAEAAIEIKCFKYSKGTEATTDNRYALLFDIENLEQYKKVSEGPLLCYEMLYTNNPNYTKEDTNSEIKLAPSITQFAQRTITKKVKGELCSLLQTVELDYVYVANWDHYDSQHYFLKIDLQNRS